jgi:hypothetical protein
LSASRSRKNPPKKTKPKKTKRTSVITQYPPSNIKLLEQVFDHIIMDSSNVDANGLRSLPSVLRHTFVFLDGSRLYITEEIEGGFIKEYHYDWVGEDGKVLLKFHSEPHPDDPRYQTETEPFHVHPPDDAKLTNRTRYPNHYHQELPSILELIALFLIANRKI